MTVKTVGLDLAKGVFQVHCVSATGRRIINKKIKRTKLLAFFETLPCCVVGMEACGSARHWGRELRKLGHDVRLMPAAYVKAYVKRGKTDATDAEAICEAVRRPTMRFVEIKSEDQQAVLAIHRARDLVVHQRIQFVNMIRSIRREFGHILPTGIEAVSKFALEHGTEDQLEMPEIADGILGVMSHQLNGLNARVDGLTKLIEQYAWLDHDARRLMRMPGIAQSQPRLLLPPSAMQNSSRLVATCPHGWASHRSINPAAAKNVSGALLRKATGTSESCSLSG